MGAHMYGNLNLCNSGVLQGLLLGDVAVQARRYRVPATLYLCRRKFEPARS